MSGHVPVLLAEVLQHLAPLPGERVLDATVGAGGHSRELAARIGPGGTLVGVDRDDDAIDRATDALKDVLARVHLGRANFRELEAELDAAGQDEVDVVLFDLGMSSMQVDDPARGFSFRNDGPLDMRMDSRDELTAEDIVNEYPEDELADLIYALGEDRDARRIARAIGRTRARDRIRTTLQLASLIERAKRRRGRIHPATKVFQALRMAVNHEVDSLTAALEAAWKRLANGGRMAVISFHSIEDRIVKNVFRDKAKSGAAELVVKKPVQASEEECADNPRARSAKLRVLRKLSVTDDDGGGAAS